MFFLELTPSDANLLQARFAGMTEDVPFIKINDLFYLETWYKIFKVIISISELIKITLLHVLFCIIFLEMPDTFSFRCVTFPTDLPECIIMIHSIKICQMSLPSGFSFL